MVTKLKTTNKIIVFIISVFLMTLSIVMIFELARLEMPLSDAFNDHEYKHSKLASMDLARYGYALSKLGAFVDEDHIIAAAMTSLDYHDLHYDERETYDYFEANYEGERSTEDGTHDPKVMAAFIEAYPDQVSDILSNRIVYQLKVYQEAKDKIELSDDVLYYFENETTTITNTQGAKPTFEALDVYYLFDDNGIYESVDRAYMTDFDLTYGQDTMYIALKDTYVMKQSEQWIKDRQALRLYLALLALSLVALAVIMYLQLGTINQDATWVISHWYLEWILFIDCIFIGLSTVFIASQSQMPDLKYILMFAISISTFTIYCLLQVVKHYKAYGLRRNYVYRILAFIGRKIGGLVKKTPFMFRMLPNPRNIDDFREAFIYLDKIKAGDFSHDLDVRSNGLYGQLIKDIDQIKDGMEQAVYNELKSERLKAELLTNVSHDIRTPLTSIVTYLDLLKQEEDPAKREDYLDVLNKKVARLNILIEDLFDAAKISSGSVDMTLETTDLKQMFQQILGEHDQEIQSKGLSFLYNLADTHVMADRKSLYRVIDNLVVNCLKYSVENSRVYVEVLEKDAIEMVIKNISKYPLNVSAEELKLRFKRGDAARSSSGSGLGLAIAEDLMRLQGGKMDLIIDGDLFKVILTMKKNKEV